MKSNFLSVIDQVQMDIGDLEGKIESIERESQQQIDGGGIGEGYDVSGSILELNGLYREMAELNARLLACQAK
ncbi:MAG: hypothetical protein WCB27_19185 [Thermoguttaceae bacterium]